MKYLKPLLIAIAPVFVLGVIGQFDHRACGADADTPRGEQKLKPILIPSDLLITHAEVGGASGLPRTGTIDVTDSTRYKSLGLTLLSRKSGSEGVDERWKRVKYDSKVFTIIFANDKLRALGISKAELVPSISEWLSKQRDMFEVFAYELKVPGDRQVPLYSVCEIVVNFERNTDEKR